jgi:serine/threonine protein kinase
MKDYEIDRFLGKGGMGSVYLARRKSDGKPVAIKVMLSAIAVDEHARRRFLREMDVVQKLTHPNIVPIIDRDIAGAAFYFVMDYCNRGSIKEFMAQCAGKLSLQDATRIIVDALKGLEFGHRNGYVHRDLKPGNILLHESDGRLGALIGDFGLAKSYVETASSGLTVTGEFGGTVQFMAREQLRNFKDVKHVSDVWSMAATFYWLLTGRVPRDFPQDFDPIRAILERSPVPIRDRNPDVPALIATVIDRALNDDPSVRYRDGAEFRKAVLVASTKAGLDVAESG